MTTASPASPVSTTHYTLIAHSVGDTTYDSKTGNHVIYGDLFLCETFTDRSKFLTAWAEVSLKSPDTIRTLINGRDQDAAAASGGSFIMDDFDQLDRDFPAFYDQAKVAQAARRQAEREENARAAEQEARRLQHLERQRDLQEFAKLKAKLDM